MSGDVRVIQPSDFVRARPDGQCDLEAGERLLAGIAEKADELQNFKTAILCPRSRFDHARFFGLCAEKRGCNVEPFTSYEEAMEWLLG